ncbi:hypothetical protein BASA50_005669 [Batrachochytrium salamandrivorans]|uniref:Uncharacterized protein n=1 Tax=Batrachochytrium salamandrivorans TaxID=1357716 RepID=A0ABQ8FCH5_9FUNG|nr:hypothetical protein BASA50_005669 [Batrachochytrium salamandrivorans]
MKAAAFATLTLLASAVCAAPPKKEYPKGPYETLRSNPNGGSFRQPRNSRSTLTQTWTPGMTYEGLNTNQRGRLGRNRGGTNPAATAGGATGVLPAAAATTASTATATATTAAATAAGKKEGGTIQRETTISYTRVRSSLGTNSEKFPDKSRITEHRQSDPTAFTSQEEAGGYYNRDFSNWDTFSGDHESPDGYETGSSTKLSLGAMMKSLPQIWKGAGEDYVTGALSICDRIIEWIVDASGLSLAELKAEYVPGEGDSETENANKLLFDYVKRKIGLVETRKELILKSARVNKGN